MFQVEKDSAGSQQVIDLGIECFFAVVRFEVVLFLLALGFRVELLFLVVALFLVEGFALAIRFLLIF